MMKLQIQKLSPNAVIPTRGSPLAAGYDVYSAENCKIEPNERALVALDISIACPIGTYARLAPRSGLTVKKGIHVGAGVVDADYRGPVKVALFNLGKETFEIKQGDRIAQLILEQIAMADIEEVTELTETVRGAGGFGSTGVSKEDAAAIEATTEANKKQRTISPSASMEDSKA